jgi:hypothetical protein
MFLQTRSEAVVQCVRDLVRAKAYLNAAIYLVRGGGRVLEEERFDILPDGSIQPPLVFGKISSQPREREVGFELGEVDRHGELELILEVNGAKDSAWLSREMWERMGEVAGWRGAPSEQTKKIVRLIDDAETIAAEGFTAEQYRLAARLDACAAMLRTLLPLQSLVEEQQRTINEGIEIAHDQAAKIEQLEALITETNRLLNNFVMKRFVAFRAAWGRTTGHLSNPIRLIDHPTYKEIVALGWPVVPYLLGDLTGDDPCHFWAQALREITGEQPVLAEEDYGKPSAVAAAWLELAKKKGWRVQSTA